MHSLGMADKNDIHPLNVTGKLYNDQSCIDCDLCREIAPQFFTRDDDEGLSYVWNQPITKDEIEYAKEVVNSCPSESIGYE